VKKTLRILAAAMFFLTLLMIPAVAPLLAVGPSYPGEPTFDPRQRAQPLAAFGWLAQPQILVTIVILTVIGSIAALGVLRILKSRQRMAVLGQAKLEVLALHAESLGQLYRRYAELHPKQVEFWSLLAADETKHARWAREIFPSIAGGEVVFHADQFPVAEIEASFRELETLLVKAVDPTCTLFQCFQGVVAVEEARSRWQLPDFFSGPERALQGIVFFHAEILAHRERLDELKTRVPAGGSGS
jgi:hypothetical protein